MITEISRLTSWKLARPDEQSVPQVQARSVEEAVYFLWLKFVAKTA